jgi:hypothetical protein
VPVWEKAGRHAGWAAERSVGAHPSEAARKARAHPAGTPGEEGVRADCESTCPKGRECWMRKDLIAPKRRDR